jgi:hypothetical protein
MAGCLARFEKRPSVGLEGALNAREGNRKALTHKMRFVGRGSAWAGLVNYLSFFIEDIFSSLSGTLLRPAPFKGASALNPAGAHQQYRVQPVGSSHWLLPQWRSHFAA